MALRKKTRSRLYQGTVYVVLGGLLIWMLLATDWRAVQQQFANPEIAMQMLPGIITIGLKNTIVFTLVAFVADCCWVSCSR